MNLTIIFITGLTVGGLTCLAVQGGLLASVIAAGAKEEGEERSKKHSLYAIGSFLAAKFIAYTSLGFLLGAFGKGLNMDGSIQSYMQLLAGMYILIVAFNLLDIHPLFRYAVIQPPRFLVKSVRTQSKSRSFFAPVLLGIMTIFIPCGTTLAMEALAVSSANAVAGGSIMAVFILGTVPLFAATGFFTSYLSAAYKNKFFKAAAVLLIVLGLTSINGALVALGSPLSLSVYENIFQPNDKPTAISQNATIEITPQGYNPTYIRVKKGLPVTLKVVNKAAYSCASAFRIPALGVSLNILPDREETVTFTPKEAGKIIFSCSMGMYRGEIEAI